MHGALDVLTIGHVCNWCDKSLIGPSRKQYCNSACRQAEYRSWKKHRTRGEEKAPCVRCGGRNPESRNQHGAFCSDCMDDRAAQQMETEESRWDAFCELDGCDNSAGWDGAGRARKFCSNAHKMKAYRLRKKAQLA